MKVIGFRSITAKATGIQYTELYLIGSDRFVIGERCESVFVRNDMITDIELLSVGVSAVVNYNRFGKVDSVSILG